MLGGLQLIALHKELVTEGPWQEKAFHDAILQQGSIPVELIRAALTTEPLNRNMPVTWRFDD